MSNLSTQRPSALDGPNATLDALGNLHAFIEDNWDALRAACGTDAERAALTRLQGWARDAYLQVLAKDIEASAGAVAQLSRDIARVTRTVGGQLAALKDMTAGLALLTNAVKLAATVAGVVTTL